jgi:hypothetical protein
MTNEHKIGNLVALAMRFYREVEAPNEHAWYAVFQCLAAQDIEGMKHLLRYNGVK